MFVARFICFEDGLELYVFCSFQIYMVERMMMQIQMECDLVSCYLWLGLIVIWFETFWVLRYLSVFLVNFTFSPLFLLKCFGVIFFLLWMFSVSFYYDYLWIRILGLWRWCPLYVSFWMIFYSLIYPESALSKFYDGWLYRFVAFYMLCCLSVVPLNVRILCACVRFEVC